MSGRLPAAAWLTAPETKAVMGALERAEPGGARFVGGCVRNTLLGQAVDDIDIATVLVPDQIIAAAHALGLEAVPTGIEHGTITVIANHHPFEVTTLRRDISTDGRRATVAFTRDWNEDAQRRDFRFNALYADSDGTLHDLIGGGIDDAREGRVHFIGDPDARIREDYLRILRFFRFFAWYGKGDPNPDGLAACARLKDGLLQLSAERVWKELKKLLAAPDPRPALIAMETSGVFPYVLPEAANRSRLDGLVEIESGIIGASDSFLRVAALLPDDPEAGRALARRLKLSNDERLRLVRALESNERIVCYMSMCEARRALYRIGAQAFRDRAFLAWAAAPEGKAAPQWRALLAIAETWDRPRLPLSGEDIIAAGVPPGPRVGAVMREVETWWIDSDFTDDKLSIAERLKAVAQGMN
ncbi:MAG TPA: CCA tRNA nucleotidyltransferase [Caulobacterales bacterium]|nr:CCA tRNA nucleotidyltransferase [Caulobacterales bacterium]